HEEIVREQRSVVFVEPINAQGVVSKVPIKGEWLLEDFVRDVARRQNNEKVSLRNRERRRIILRLTTVKRGVGGWDQGSVGRDGSRTHRRIVIGEEAGSHRDSQLVANMQPGKKLLLELVSVPLQLGIARVRVV